MKRNHSWESQIRRLSICLCVSLWSGELQAMLSWISPPAVSRGHNTGVTWQRLSAWHFCFILIWFHNPFHRSCWSVAPNILLLWLAKHQIWVTENDWIDEIVTDLGNSNISFSFHCHSDDQNNAKWRKSSLYNSTALCHEVSFPNTGIIEHDAAMNAYN